MASPFDRLMAVNLLGELTAAGIELRDVTLGQVKHSLARALGIRCRVIAFLPDYYAGVEQGRRAVVVTEACQSATNVSSASPPAVDVSKSCCA